MKKITLLLVFAIIATIAQAQYKYLSPFNSEGVPAVLDYEPISERMRANIKASLPESYPVPSYHPQYISNGSDTDIRITEDADVWVTFVDEGAGYRNTLGFYTYTGGPRKPNAEEITIIFPNVSKIGSGGGLGEGFKVHLGRFSAGTNIGWVLIADGFRNGKVTNGNWILYSTPDFNPEGNASLRYHNVLLKDEAEQKMVLGFEDIRRDYGNCDQDFNDAIFYITTNPASVLMNSNVNVVTESGSASTGNIGGLESNGSLAQHVTQRHFQRQITPQLDYDSPTENKIFIPEKSLAQARSSAFDLSQWIPQKPFEEATEAYTSTPSDLVSITNAKEVLAVDYFSESKRVAAILSLYTENEVYNHAKTICDRLNGSSINDIQLINIRDKEFILTQIKHLDQTVEYVICFSVADLGYSFSVERHWKIDDFPKGNNYFNFQVWAQAPHLAQAIAEKILLQFELKKALLFREEKVSIPKIYVRQGSYKNGNLYIDLINHINAKKVKIKGSLSRTETQQNKDNLAWEISLTGDNFQRISIPTNQLFDCGLEIVNDGSGVNDVLYMADSPWGVDTKNDKVDKFEVSNNQFSNDSNSFWIERNAYMKGNVKNNVSLFKLLKTSAKESDMSNYKGIQFEAKGVGIVEVILMKKSITNSDEQFRVEIQLTEKMKNFTIPYSEFYSTKSKKIKVDDITAVVFSFVGNNLSSKLFEIQVNNLLFFKEIKNEIKAELSSIDVSLFPNPCTDGINVAFETQDESESEINIFDNRGIRVISVLKSTNRGKNIISIPVIDLSSGIYFVQVKNKNQIKTQKLMVIR